MATTDARQRLLDATLRVVRERGLGATRVDDVCECAGLTKGSFFHHFKGKDDLLLAAARHWDEHTHAFFAAGSDRAQAQARDRLLAYVDFRIAGLDGELWAVTCFAGTVVQDAYQRQPELAALCAGNILDHAAELEREVQAAIDEAATADGRAQVDWTARSLALHIQGAIQGALILAKATGDVAAARDALQHLQRHLAHVLPVPHDRMQPTALRTRAPSRS
jgi:TetR/AcrR family transcriptional repressor of nem operon